MAAIRTRDVEEHRNALAASLEAAVEEHRATINALAASLEASSEAGEGRCLPLP